MRRDIAQAGKASKSKRFFFEKKKQKTFDLLGARAPPLPQTQRIKVFFASFLFTKKKSFLAYLSV